MADSLPCRSLVNHFVCDLLVEGVVEAKQLVFDELRQVDLRLRFVHDDLVLVRDRDHVQLLAIQLCNATRPTLHFKTVYGAETSAVKKAHEKMEVAEMKMLRWTCGVTRLDKIRNEKIRGSTKVGEISKKVQECRMRWYGHVMRRDEEYVGKRVMGIEAGEEDRRRGGWTV